MASNPVMSIVLFAFTALVLNLGGAYGQTIVIEKQSGTSLTSNTRLNLHAPFIYLGVVNNKAFYYENETVVTQTGARSKCHGMGMKLARIDTTDEIVWLNNRITGGVSTQNAWTDGVLVVRPQSFKWMSDGSSLATDLNVEMSTSCSLHLYADGRVLMGYQQGIASKALCYLNVPGVSSASPKAPLSHNHVVERSHVGGYTNVQADEAFHNSNSSNAATSYQLDKHVAYERILAAGFVYLGRYGSKTFYIDRQQVLVDEARRNCTNFGLKLAKLDSQNEMQWLSTVTESADTLLWTDGTPKSGDATIFKWVAEDEQLPIHLNSAISHFINSRLAFARGTAPKLVTRDGATSTSRERLAYLCYL